MTPSPQALKDAQRILDAAARRLLEEQQREVEPMGSKRKAA